MPLEIPGTGIGADESQLTAVGRRVRDFTYSMYEQLPNLAACTDAEVAFILLKYAWAFEPNFIGWLAVTWMHCPYASAGRKEAGSNLACEVSQDHQAMLSRFTSQISEHLLAELSADERLSRNTFRVQLLLDNIDQMVAIDDYDKISGSTGLMLMMVLENASLAFIPWLRQAGQRLQFTDFEYTDKHGVDDIDHACAFLRVVEELFRFAEMHDNPEKREDYSISLKNMLDEVLDVTGELLRSIFSPHWPDMPEPAEAG